VSAYLSRLIQRFSPPSSTDPSAAFRPFVRSQSPIAAIDQRLGIDESLGHGLGELGDGLTEVEGGPETPQIHREIASPPFVAAAASSPEMPSSSRVAAPIEPSRPSPAMAPASLDAETPSELGRVPLPFDPGPVVGPFARHRHHDQELPRPPIEASRVEATPLGRAGAREPTTTPPSILGLVSGPKIASASESASVVNAEPAARPTQPAPWIVLERAPAITPPGDLEVPRLAPPRPSSEAPNRGLLITLHPSPPVKLDVQPAPLLIEPRAEPRAELVTDPGEVPAPRPEHRPPPTARERVEPASKRRAAPRPQPQLASKGRLDIDSISKIGPLARHFPNRRRFRLRFR
jgi:hypothetical protein